MKCLAITVVAVLVASLLVAAIVLVAVTYPLALIPAALVTCWPLIDRPAHPGRPHDPWMHPRHWR